MSTIQNKVAIREEINMSNNMGQFIVGMEMSF